MGLFDYTFDYTFTGDYTSIIDLISMGCSLTGSIQSGCVDLKQIGGLSKTFYIGNLDDLAAAGIVSDGSGYVYAINFLSYAGLYKFITKKLTGSAGFDAAVGAGATQINQTVTQKLFKETPTAYARIEELLNSDVFVIVEDNNGNFKLYGKNNGLTVSALTGNSGAEITADTGILVTFTGAETELPKFVLKTNANATRQYLESLVVG
jgi:hypothetical protein